MIGAIKGGGAAAPQEVTFENISLISKRNAMLSKAVQGTKVTGFNVYNSASGGKLSSGCHLYQCFIENGTLYIAITNMATDSAKVDVKVYVE